MPRGRPKLTPEERVATEKRRREKKNEARRKRRAEEKEIDPDAYAERVADRRKEKSN